MARYIQCKKCYNLSADLVDCDECGEVLNPVVVGTPAIHMFPTGYWEHLDIVPTKIRGRQHLKDECNRLGVRANILD